MSGGMVQGAGDPEAAAWRRMGDMVMRVRALRRFSRDQLADLAGISASALKRVELGHQPLKNIETVEKLADALGVPAEAILDARHTDDSDNSAPHAMSSVDLKSLIEVVSLFHPASGVYGGSLTRVELLPIERLQDELRLAEQLQANVRYRLLGGVLPRMLRELIVAVRHHPGQRRPLLLLSSALQLSSTVLRYASEYRHSLTACDQSIVAAQAADAPMSAAVGARHLARTCVYLHNYDEACSLVARHLQSVPQSRSGLIVTGQLAYQGAYAAGRKGDREAVQHFHEVAASAADRLGYDEVAYGLPFGPTSLAIHEALLHLEQDQPRAALRVAEAADPANAPTTNIRALLYSDIAQARLRTHDAAGALRALLAKEAIAPEHMKQPAVQRMVTDLLTLDRRGALPETRHLAARVGVLH